MSTAFLGLKVTASGTTVRSLEARMCGVCHRLMDNHPYEDDDYQSECDRMPWDFGSLNSEFYSDYYRHAPAYSGSPKGTITLYRDNEGPGTSPLLEDDYDRDLEDNYVSLSDAMDEEATLNAWRDQATDIATVTREQYLARPDVTEARFELVTVPAPGKNYYSFFPVEEYDPSIEPALRNAYVEGNDAFLSLQVLDPELTRKYHARLLNWFLDKSGEVRVGSMRFFVNEHGERIAQCVRSCAKDEHGNWYKPGARIDNYSHSREAMETFILSVITHGNNCAASFIRNRADWYATGTPEPKRYTDNDVEFVLSHQQYCKDARCKCSEWLASEVPALASNYKETA